MTQQFYSAAGRPTTAISLKHVEQYAKIYREYIQNNLLDDDSDEISISDLIDFVEDHIIPANPEKFELYN